MRNRSDKWKSLAVRGRFRTEAKLIDGDGTVFTRISAPEITRNIMTSPLAIGNSTAATLSVSILMKDTDKVVSPVDVQIRLSDGTKDPDSLTESDYSEWLTMGTFFIDSRDTDSEPVYEPIYDEDGKLTDSVGYQLVKLTAYDALLKTSSVYYNINNPATSSFPKTMKTLVEEIAERIDVEIDPRTAAGMKSWDSSVYVISEQPVDTTTMQTLLQDVAKCFGGSWIVTPENKLRLVTITDSPKETNYVVSSDYERIELPGGVNLADDILVHAENPTDFSVEQWESVMHVPVVCGTISTGVPQTIVGVSCKAGSMTYTAGQEGNSKTGAYQLSITSTYADQNVCDNLYKTFNGMVYNPYTATKTRYDPAAELGDSVYISTKVWSVLYSETVKYDIDFSSDISAPTSQSLYSEYPYETAASKIQQVKQDIKETNDSLNTTKEEFTSEIDKTNESLNLTVKKYLSNPSNYCQLNKDTAESFGFDCDTSETDYWYSPKTISRKILISEFYTCNGGEVLGIESTIDCRITGATTEGGTDNESLEAAVCVFWWKDEEQNEWGDKEYVSFVGDTPEEGTETSGIITLPNEARIFAVALMVLGYPTITGTLRIKNVSVTMGGVNGENIVAMINLDDSGVTIQGNKVDILGNTTFKSLTETNDSGETVINGGKIQTDSIVAGTIKANSIVAENIANGQIMQDLYTYKLGTSNSGFTLKIENGKSLYTQFLLVFKGTSWEMGTDDTETSSGYKHTRTYYSSTQTLLIPANLYGSYTAFFEYPQQAYQRIWTTDTNTEEDKQDNYNRSVTFNFQFEYNVTKVARQFTLTYSGNDIVFVFSNGYMFAGTSSFLWSTWEKDAQKMPNHCIPYKIYGIR